MTSRAVPTDELLTEQDRARPFTGWPDPAVVRFVVVPLPLSGGTLSRVHPPQLIIPAPTVRFVDSSMRMNPPVLRLRW
jgi:hypothetical protein